MLLCNATVTDYTDPEAGATKLEDSVIGEIQHLLN